MNVDRLLTTADMGEEEEAEQNLPRFPDWMQAPTEASICLIISNR